ncbi:hypothetical protein GF358_02640 [Candidatus Woesearchaeota archaeon]|nr:hypothetical protein [Candidatus Woesearchaeota archaeon]
MKQLMILTALLLLIPLAQAYNQQDILNAQKVTTHLELSQDIELVKKGPGYTVDLLTAELYNFPQDDTTQRILKRQTEPKSEKKDDMLKFRWPSPNPKLNIKVTSTVETRNEFNPLKEKITYPIRDQLDRGYDNFLKPTQFIDFLDPAIKTKAKELATEEDDLYIIVSRIANWVNKQVKYDLNTKTEKATQTASWVMQNKQGVCDEITGLFIALLRAADIPARFVSGISYTPTIEGEKWGSHGWAEVFYPERGWVPYDITFGQYGRIDPGHIKFKETLDPRDKPIRFEWYGRDAGLEAKDIKIKADIQETEGRADAVISILTRIAKKETGIGSYNLVTAEITNLKDHYITKEMILANVEEMEIHGSKKKLAVLKPNEKQKLYWRVKVKEEIDPEYTYDVPIEVYTQWGDVGTTKFRAKKDYPVYSLDDIVKIQDAIEAGEYVIQAKKYTPPKETETKKTTQTIKKEPPKEKTGIIQKIIKWLKQIFR